jgi:hypothetical protein
MCTKPRKEVKLEITMEVPKTMKESVLKDKIERMFSKDNVLWMFVYRFKVKIVGGGK